MTLSDVLLNDLRNVRIFYESARVGTRPLGRSHEAMRRADTLSAMVLRLDVQLSSDLELPTDWTYESPEDVKAQYPTATRFQLASDGGAVALDLHGTAIFKVAVNGTITRYDQDGSEIV